MLFPPHFFFFLISLAALLYATYSDLKSRTVSDKLNYFLVLSGIFSHLGLSIFLNNWQFMASCIISIAVAFAFSWLLWKLGIWAGGDVKLFTALSAINPVNYAALANMLGIDYFSFSLGYSIPIFPISLFLFSILSMFPYAVIITISKLSKPGLLREKLYSGARENLAKLFVFSLFATGFERIFISLNLPSYLYLPVFFIALLLMGITKISEKIIFVAFSVLAFIYALLSGGINSVFSLLETFIILSLFYILLKLASLSRESMRKEIAVGKLEEGTIVAELLVERNNMLYREELPSIGTILNHLRANKLEKIVNIGNIEGIVLASPRSAAGLTDKALKRIKELSKVSGIESVKITESAPFVPAVLIGYIALQLFGDVFWKIIFH